MLQTKAISSKIRQRAVKLGHDESLVDMIPATELTLATIADELRMNRQKRKMINKAFKPTEQDRRHLLAMAERDDEEEEERMREVAKERQNKALREIAKHELEAGFSEGNLSDRKQTPRGPP